jgi:hypothetical protein
LALLLAIVYGILSIVLAFAAQGMGSILSATITAAGALSGPLGAVFAMGILMPFINKIVRQIELWLQYEFMHTNHDLQKLSFISGCDFGNDGWLFHNDLDHDQLLHPEQITHPIGIQCR